MCTKTCPDGYYANSTTNKCERCTICKTCSITATNCTSCNGTYYIEDGTEVPARYL